MSEIAVAEFEDVGKFYPTGVFGRGQRLAVQDISLRINPGEVFALLGPNRAGKTTLVKILLSLCRPTTGRGLRFGRPLAERQTLARVGYVHENPAFPRYLSAMALLEYYGALALLTEPVVRKRAVVLLDIVGLSDRGHEPISRFSKGMIQRLAIAQALLNDPELLVLDEPSEGLDLSGRRLVRDVIAERRRRGMTVLLVSHVLGEVEQVCDRLAVLVGGYLVHSGTVAGLARDPETGASCPLEQALDRLYVQPPVGAMAEQETVYCGPRSGV
ncbi:MAG TPA: ABC transporter ATP-binding protein [Gemmataceae bacterium]|nr:ABC transporter ATP-binding protein [Gemmataceae bacterium]